MYSKEETQVFTFGTLSFTVRNWKGIFIMSDNLKAKIKNMSVEDAKAANKEAWKQRNVSVRIANRHCNMSCPGNSNIYETNCAIANISEAVAKETWKRMMGY